MIYLLIRHNMLLEILLLRLARPSTRRWAIIYEDEPDNDEDEGDGALDI